MEKSDRNNLTGLVVGLLVSVVVIWFLFRDLDWPSLSSYFERINYQFIPIVLLFSWSSYWLRALRWKLLIPTNNSVALKNLYHATSLGLLASWILPLRAGEFIRPWALSKSDKVSFSSAFASIVVERVFDVLALLVVLGICLPQIEDIPPVVAAGSYILGALASVISVVVVVAYLSGEWLLKTLDSVLGLLFSEGSKLRDSIISMAEEFTTGLRSISSFSEFFKAILYTIGLWMAFIGMYWSVLWCFGETGSAFLAALVTVMVGLAIAAPSGPGFVGTFQFGCVLALTTLSGYTKEFSIAYSVLNHALQAGFGVLLGLLSLKSMGLSFSSLTSSIKSSQNLSTSKSVAN